MGNGVNKNTNTFMLSSGLRYSLSFIQATITKLVMVLYLQENKQLNQRDTPCFQGAYSVAKEI